ncbi:TonB-dependent receptor [Xanthobacter pseudotagetidis]|uniref:TonB-dependent receptor n=1 Tax=Xanthobacter pseudotagetidis TaxID=3119911 RepID=UPI00372624D1
MAHARRFALAFALLAAPSAALAQQPEATIELDELTVEAMRRAQPFLNVMASVRVFTEKDIEARTIERLEDAFDASVNTLMRSQRGGNDASVISIRGVANTAFGTDPTVAIYRDDVFIGNDASFNLTMVDLDQIEILRGPQGTLYGRNAIAGAVNVRSARPEFGATYTKLDVLFGTDMTLQGRAVVNAALGSDLAVRAVAFGDYSNGWVPNLADGQLYDGAKDGGGRFQVFARPSENLELLFSADYATDQGSRGNRGPFGTVWADGYNAAIPYVSSISSYGTSVKASYDFGGAELVSVTAWRGADGEGTGGDFTPSPFRQNGFTRSYDQASQEVRLVSKPNDKLEWTVGTFFFGSDETRYESTGFNYPVPANVFYPGQPALPAGYEEGTNSNLFGWSAAAYGDATWHVTDKLDILAGARLSYDRREIDYDHHSNVPGITLGAPAQLLLQSMDSTDLSPKIGLAYEVAPKVRAYATISRGYKAGGFNLSFAPTNDLAYEPESAWNYEGGVKASLFDGRLDVAASVFYFDWTNQQIYSFNGYSVWIANAPKSRNYGAEIEIKARPVDGLELFAGLGLLDARFIDAPASQSGGNADGNWQPLASKYSLSLSAQYTRPLTAQLNGIARVDWNWRSSFYFDVDNTIEQEAYGIVNARLGVEAKDWSLYLVALNLLNQEYYTVATNNGYGPYGAPGDPRMIGVQARSRF